MRKVYIVFAFLTVLFVILCVGYYRRVEGFAAVPSVRQGNYVLDLLGNLKRSSKMLADPSLWRDRMQFIGKSPVDIAREYIKSQSKKE
jgi:hypothetical protein